MGGAAVSGDEGLRLRGRKPKPVRHVLGAGWVEAMSTLSVCLGFFDTWQTARVKERGCLSFDGSVFTFPLSASTGLYSQR